MKDLVLKVEPMGPSQNLTPEIIKKQFIFRNTGQYIGPSIVAIFDMQEPVWWNRPLESEELCKKEADGIYSYNLPFLFRKSSYKTGYNILLNKNSVPLAVQIKISPSWTVQQMNLVQKFIITATFNALTKLGVPANRLEKTKNDLLFDGKKFLGGEETQYGGWLTADYVITMQYKPEKEIFDRLTGQYAQRRGITGIIEETNLFTKEEFIEALLAEIKLILDQLD